MGNKQLDIQDTRKENVKGYKEEEFKVVNKEEAGEYPLTFSFQIGRAHV